MGEREAPAAKWGSAAGVMKNTDLRDEDGLPRPDGLAMTQETKGFSFEMGVFITPQSALRLTAPLKGSLIWGNYLETRGRVRFWDGSF